MAAERLSMRKIKELLRLKAAGHGNREIARSLVISHSTVKEYLRRAAVAGVSWPLPGEWTDGQLEAQLFPPESRPSSEPRPLPDWAEVHREMKARKKTKVTLQLLWFEYKQDHPDGLQYSQFCHIQEAEIFVGVLGASNFTYAEGCWGQTLPEWIDAHVHMYAYFGGVPQLYVLGCQTTGSHSDWRRRPMQRGGSGIAGAGPSRS